MAVGYNRTNIQLQKQQNDSSMVGVLLSVQLYHTVSDKSEARVEALRHFHKRR